MASDAKYAFRTTPEMLDALRELSAVTGRSMNVELKRALALHLTRSVLYLAMRDTSDVARIVQEQAEQDLAGLESATYGGPDPRNLFDAVASMN